MNTMVDPKRLNDPGAIDLDRCYAEADRWMAVTRRTQALLAAAGEAVSEPFWYALTVRDGSERTVGELVEKAGWTTWLALEPVEYRRRGRRIETQRAAFPGYVFTRLRWSPEACHSFKAIDGLFGIVGGWEAPHRVGERELVEAKGFFMLTPTQRKREAVKRLGIGVGDKVEIGRGPFATFGGEVVEEADAVSMWVEIMLFGRSTRTRVDLANLSRIGVTSRP